MPLLTNYSRILAKLSPSTPVPRLLRKIKPLSVVVSKSIPSIYTTTRLYRAFVGLMARESVAHFNAQSHVTRYKVTANTGEDP